ncbi:hypothetical protein GCM10010191_27530 [Actinomadura vinacea]|uniref:Restriction endonuclease type IV Mrr domain-containing protein n=1 Tax=Actinomadura vinacea TaxID=115336 RepID=A0ABN3IXY8_9ACTN
MSEFEDRIRKWLQEQGYPLELQVAEILRTVATGWSHWRSYIDPNTDKEREIDIMGYFDDEPLSVHLVFECKHSGDKPWILFSTDQTYTDPQSLLRAVPATIEARKMLRRGFTRIIRKSIELLKPPERLGFNLVKAYSGNQDAAFHAVYGVTNAAIGSARLEDEDLATGSTAFIPVTVVDAPLFQCYLPQGSEDLVIERIEHGLLIRHLVDGESVLMHIVTVKELPNFLDSIKTDIRKINSVLSGL